MEHSPTKANFAIILCLIFPFSGKSIADDVRSLHSAKNFVTSFYQWYMPKLQGGTYVNGVDVALGDGRNFDRKLEKLLKEDRRAQSNCRELVSIDFDPFLNSQDPASSVQIGVGWRKGNSFVFPIFDVESEIRTQTSRVSAEVTRQDGKWVFLNFHYPEGQDLLTQLNLPKPKCHDFVPQRRNRNVPT